jgi:hypothetical protein
LGAKIDSNLPGNTDQQRLGDVSSWEATKFYMWLQLVGEAKGLNTTTTTEHFNPKQARVG